MLMHADPDLSLGRGMCIRLGAPRPALFGFLSVRESDSRYKSGVKREALRSLKQRNF